MPGVCKTAIFAYNPSVFEPSVCKTGAFAYNSRIFRLAVWTFL